MAKWPAHYPITGMPIDDIWKLLNALKKVDLPDKVARQVAELRVRLEKIDEEQGGGLSEYRTTAKAAHHKDGELEIDDNAVVSASGDDGAYVMAWVWVSDSEL